MPGNRSESRRKSHWLFRLLGVSGWLLALGTFLLCIPTPLGPARLGFTIVSGHSMEPTYWTNDIVVTWRTGHYAVGEPIVYTIPTGEPGAGFHVVHRIADIRANGTYETLGDNNAAPDIWQPGPDNVKGHVFFRIPKLGLVFHPGVLPLVLAGIAGLFVSMAVWNWLDEDEKPDRDDDPPSGSGPPRRPRRRLGWPRRAGLALALVLFGTASASHAATLGGVRTTALFAMTANITPAPPAPPAGGLGLAALVQGGGGSLDLKLSHVTGNVVLNADGTDGGNCNPTEIDGDLILYGTAGGSSGTATLTNCTISGNLYAYGNVDIGNAVKVGKDAISTHGSLTIRGTVAGKAMAAGTIDVHNPGTVSGSGTCAAPGCVQHASSIPALLPRSAWYDYDTTAAAWERAGYVVKTLGPGGTLSAGCSLKSDPALVAAISDLSGRPVVIDATRCSTLELAGRITLHTDVTFLTAGFASPDNSLTLTSAGGDHRFNVIQPDPVAGSQAVPNCASGQESSMTGWKMADAHVSGLVYTPCPLKLGNAGMAWRGQIYAGTIDSQGASSTVTYAPVNGLPGAATTGGFGS